MRIDVLLIRSDRGKRQEIASYEFGGMRFDFHQSELMRNGSKVELSQRETRLLRLSTPIGRRWDQVQRVTAIKDHPTTQKMLPACHSRPSNRSGYARLAAVVTPARHAFGSAPLAHLS